MSRSQTTALYTRVDNSFSNPVTGTTISPSDADTFFDDVEAAVNAFIATSASSVAIGTGAKTFTVASDIANKVFIAGTFVHIYSRADTADYMFGTVTSYSTSTGALVTDITATGGSGTNTDWNIAQAGARGATGATGSTGATGAASGIKQAYSTTTTDADPGAGIFRLNHATPASATAAYLDNADAAAATVSTIIDLWDDSTTTTKGYVRFEKSTDPTVWAQFAVTGSVVDGTGYRKLTLTSGAGSGAFTNADTFAITFFRSGDKGTDGAGTGDVVGPGSATADHVVLFDGTTGKLIKSAGAGAVTQGKQTIFIPVAAMRSRTTNGAAAGLVEQTTNKNMVISLDFDTATQEFAQFSVWFPKSWNLGTVTFQPCFSQLTTAAGGVVFGLAGVAVSDADALDVAFGTAQTSTKTAGTANLEYQGPESSAITIAGTPAAGDRVLFQINRTVADASDTLAQDARLHGIRLFFTTNAATDT